MRKKHLEDEDEDEDEGGATYRTVTCAGARAEKRDPSCPSLGIASIRALSFVGSRPACCVLNRAIEAFARDVMDIARTQEAGDESAGTTSCAVPFDFRFSIAYKVHARGMGGGETRRGRALARSGRTSCSRLVRGRGPQLRAGWLAGLARSAIRGW